MTVKKGTSLEQIPVILFILSASRIKPGNDSSVASGSLEAYGYRGLEIWGHLGGWRGYRKWSSRVGLAQEVASFVYGLNFPSCFAYFQDGVV